MLRLRKILTIDMLLLVGVGALVLVWKCWIVLPVSHIGHNDAMGYAEMADSLLHGRGLSVDYVSFHFIQYPGIPRPEDHWPPLYSFLILPFYLLLGKLGIAFKLPSLIISSLALPLVTYAFTRQLSRDRWTSLGSAFTVLFYPRLFFWSLFCLSDVTYTFIFLLVALFILRGFEYPRSFYSMGCTIGLAYYAKGSAILLIPSAILFYLVKRPSLRRLVCDRQFLVGLALAVGIMAPFWLRNTIHFGDPFHSTQNYWSGNIGYSTDGPSNGNTYRVYWDITKPSWRATKLPLGASVLLQKSWEYFDRQFQWAFINMGNNEPLTLKSVITLQPIRTVFAEFPGYPSGIPVGLFGIPTLLALPVLFRRRDIYIVPILLGPLLLFLSIFWAPIDRLILVSVPLVLALGWTAYHALLTRVLHHAKHHTRIIAVMLIGLTVTTSALAIRSSYRSWQTGKHGTQPSFVGAVDEIRIYNRALSEAEVATNAYVNIAYEPDSAAQFVTDGLVSYWSFDEQSIHGETVRDEWGENDGLKVGKPKRVPGKLGEALAFDGHSCVEVPGGDNLQLSDAFTVETWVLGRHAPNQSASVTQWLGKSGNYVLSWDHNSAYARSIAFQGHDGRWPAAQIGDGLQPDTWYHIAATWDSQMLRVYLNGGLADESQVDIKPATDAAPLRIGGTTVGGGFPYAHGPFEREQLLAVQWLREHTAPDDVIMDCDPWALQFYSDRRCVHFACDTPEQIFRVMRHYGVTYITYDIYEAAHPKTLDDYYSGTIPGFDLVYDVSPRLKIYRVSPELLSRD